MAKRNARRRKKKQPVAGLDPSSSKTPKVPSFAESKSMTPCWRVSRLRMSGPFGWNDVEAAVLKDIRKKLQHFETMTWKEILRPGERNHRIDLTKITTEARKDLMDAQLDDVDYLVSLRLSSTRRLWGILEAGVFSIIWWDPEHKVYPSPKRNT